MIGLHKFVVWIATGSQHHTGPETFQRVEQHSRSGVDALNTSGELPVRPVFKPLLTTPGAAPRKVAAGRWRDAQVRQRVDTGRRGAPYRFQPVARTGIPGGRRINN